MGNTLAAWGYNGTPAFRKMGDNKAEAAALTRQIDSMPLSRLTVGDLRFVLERPRDSMWPDDCEAIRFYTDARIARLREIASRG